jgi:5-methylcytosine-specific restriction enzyme subunit McrC
MEIPIQNIYYLLCYAWDKLEEGNTVNVQAISTTELIDLFAKVLINGTTRLLKQGLDRYYIENDYLVHGVKGKLDLSASVKRNILPANQTICLYDEFDFNVLHNQILKTTLYKLLRIDNLDNNLRNELHRVYSHLPKVSEITIHPFHFKQIRLHRNNYHYDFILKVCQIINDNLFIDESTGRYKFKDFIREEKAMARLFESFVRNFYKLEQSEYKVGSELIKWKFLTSSDDEYNMLPIMQTDISLTSSSRKIIIDTKYYKEAFKVKYSKDKINSNHLYQLYSYLNNQELDSGISQSCEGILLYPTIDDDFKYRYYFDNHSITVMSLNLNQDWVNIRDDLLKIV